VGCRWICAALITALALMAGCGGAIPKTHYYVLDLPAPALAAPRAADDPPSSYTAVVMPFRAPEPLDQDRIVYSSSPVELSYYQYHRWAELPAPLLTSALAGRVRNLGLFANVSIFDGRTKGDYLIRPRLERLEEIDREGGVTVRVQISAEAVEAKTNHVVWRSEASHSGAVTAGEVGAVVTEMSRGAEACLEKITGDLRNLQKAFPPAPTSSEK
jgi:ABC-type uncharacterized transport system auxiliary subunit